MYDIHAGVTPAHLPTVLDFAAGYGRVFSDGDGWNTWGEAPGTDVNDATTRHVLVRVEDLGRAIDIALAAGREYRDYLVASNGYSEEDEHAERQNGNVIVVTDSEDWSISYLVVTERGIRTVANEVTE